MPGPTFQTSGTNLDGLTTAAPQFPAPAGVAQDDIIIVAFYTDGSTVTVSTPPAGFSAGPSIPVETTGAPAGYHKSNLYWKRATGGGEPATYDFTLSGSTFVEGRAHRYSDCRKSGSPWGSVATAFDSSGTATLNVGPVSSTIDNSLFVHMSTCWAGGGWTPSSGFTERQDGSVGLVQLSDKAQASAGSSGTVAATCVNSDKQTAWLGVLEPDVPAGSFTPQMPPWLMLRFMEAAYASQFEASATTQVVAEGGISSIGFAGSGGEAKIANESGISTVGLAGSGADSKIAPEGGSSFAGLAGRGTEIKVMPEGGSAFAGLSSRGGEVRVAKESGTSTIGLSGAGSEMKIAKESGQSSIGLIGFTSSQNSTTFMFFFMS